MIYWSATRVTVNKTLPSNFSYSSAPTAILKDVTRVTFSKINHRAIFSPAVLPDEVRFLWRRAATVKPVSGSDLQVGERGPESTDSEKEREREMVEAAEREEERLGLSAKEVWKGVYCLFVWLWWGHLWSLFVQGEMSQDETLIVCVCVWMQVPRDLAESEMFDISGKPCGKMRPCYGFKPVDRGLTV